MSESRGRSRSRASSSSTGDRAVAAETTRSALRTAPVGDHSSRSSTARASALHSARARSIWAGGSGRGRRWREPARVGLEGLADRTDQVQSVVVTPDQSAGPKVAYGSRPRWTAGGRAARPGRRSSSGRAARPAPRRPPAARHRAGPAPSRSKIRWWSGRPARPGPGAAAGPGRAGRGADSVRASSSQVRRDSARVRGRDFESTAYPQGDRVGGAGRAPALRLAVDQHQGGEQQAPTDHHGPGAHGGPPTTEARVVGQRHDDRDQHPHHRADDEAPGGLRPGPP